MLALCCTTTSVLWTAPLAAAFLAAVRISGRGSQHSVSGLAWPARQVSASCGLPREAASQAKQDRSRCAASRGLIFAQQPEMMLLEELSKAQTSWCSTARARSGLLRQFRNSPEVLVQISSTVTGELNNDFRARHPIPAEKLKSPRGETPGAPRRRTPRGPCGSGPRRCGQKEVF